MLRVGAMAADVDVQAEWHPVLPSDDGGDGGCDDGGALPHHRSTAMLQAMIGLMSSLRAPALISGLDSVECGVVEEMDAFNQRRVESCDAELVVPLEPAVVQKPNELVGVVAMRRP